MSNRPLIHFAHANGIPAGTYKILFSHIEKYADICALPMLAHNPNYPIKDNWAELVNELIDYIDTLAVKKPIIGLGHSLGASLTYLASKKRPDLFSQVILLDPPMLTGYHSLLFILVKHLGMIDKFSPAGKSKYRKSHWKNRQAVFENLSQKKLYTGWPEQSLWDYIDSVTTHLPSSEEVKLSFLVENECEIFRTIPTFMDYRKPLNPVPTTLFYGEDSDVCTNYVVNRIRKKQHIPVIKVKGGHMYPLQYAQETAELISNMVRAELPSK